MNAAVLGTFSLVVAALFMLDLMGPRIYTAAHHSQTDVSTPVASKKVSIVTVPVSNGHANGHIPNGHTAAEKPKDDVEKREKPPKKTETSLFNEPRHGYTKFDEKPLETEDLEQSKFGSLRSGIEGGNYIRISDPIADNDRLHYEQELAKFNERYFKEFLEQVDGRFNVKENYLPEPQTPLFAKVKSGRLRSLYDDASPTYDRERYANFKFI